MVAVLETFDLFREAKRKSDLTKKLRTKGYSISAKLDIPDINEDNKPYCFMVDEINKKWFLANYKASYAEAFDYYDIADYRITYRLIGTAVVKGKKFSGSYSEFADTKTKILDIVDLNSKNCEYIDFSITYRGKALYAHLCDKFVLFENQQGNFIYAKNHDFVTPSHSISNAKEFENLLFQIVSK